LFVFAFVSPQNRNAAQNFILMFPSLPALCASPAPEYYSKHIGIRCWNKNKQKPDQDEPIFYFLVVEIENWEGAKGKPMEFEPLPYHSAPFPLTLNFPSTLYPYSHNGLVSCKDVV
jgi:hypothetical protein